MQNCPTFTPPLPLQWHLPLAFMCFALVMHVSATSLEESNLLWWIGGCVNTALNLGHYRRAKAIEPHRHDLLILMMVVFPIIEFNRWLGYAEMSDAHIIIELGCFTAFTFYISRFSSVELRRSEDRLGTPGICADSLMISTALLACAFPVLLGQLEVLVFGRGFGAMMAMAYLTVGVYLLIGTLLILSTARLELRQTDVVLMASSTLLFIHFLLYVLAVYATTLDALALVKWSYIVSAAAGAFAMLYLRMPPPPTVPRQPINRLRVSSLMGAGLLVLALPAAWLILGEQAQRTPVWVWAFCGAACTAVLSMRLIPLLSQALRWKQEYQRLALHDSLTGLDNRHAIDTLPQDPAGREASDVVVFCIDLDDFKSINDLYGHPTGDLLLRAVADSLRGQVQQWQAQWPATYKLARLGGDEFLIFITTGAGCWSRSQMLHMAEHLYHRLARWWDLGVDSPVFCKASVGCETKPLAQWQAALHGADKALYASKMSHTGPVASLPSTDLQAPHRQQIRQWTHQALAGPPLPLDLQAIVCASTHQIMSYEVLARLPHPDAPGQRLMPATFLKVIDRDGLHRLLCSRILETLASHHQALQGLHLSINIDPCLLTSMADAQWLHQQVLDNQLQPQRLTLEVLEKQVTDDKSLQAAMAWLSNQGYRLAMDDFGSGYSNFQRLSELPFNVLKIDATVIHAAALGDEAPLQSIHRLAMRRNMSLVAEGVATVRQLAAVQRAGIKLVQGFLHGRPCPIGLIAAHEAELAHAGLAREPGPPA